MIHATSDAHGSELMILRYSGSVNAFRVCLVTLPDAATERENLAQVSSSGNSETNTASYFSMVRYQA